MIIKFFSLIFYSIVQDIKFYLDIVSSFPSFRFHIFHQFHLFYSVIKMLFVITILFLYSNIIIFVQRELFIFGTIYCQHIVFPLIGFDLYINCQSIYLNLK